MDNFTIIRPHLNIESEDEFYYITILKRKKDNPNSSQSVRMIRNYYISSINKFDEVEEEIKELCEFFNARAYINLNKRSFKSTALETLKKVANLIAQEQYKPIKGAYNSVVGKGVGKKNKTWILDLDVIPKNKMWFMELKTILKNTQPINNEEKIKEYIPTNNGLHIITTPFNLMEFYKKIDKAEHKEIFDFLEVKKDNPTLLYSTNHIK